MGSNIYFSVPTTTWKPFTHSQRPKPASRKRKRNNESIDSSEDGINSSAQGDPTVSSSARQSPSKPRLIFTPDDIAQFKVAGHSTTEPIPGLPFPHRDLRSGKDQSQLFSSDDQEPQDSGNSDKERGISRKRTLRQQHLGVLTTMLHRCVMQKDFARAKRAFGLLLRDEIGGQAVDIRTGGRWGLGAEILMHADQTKTSLPPLPPIPADENPKVSEHSEVGRSPQNSGLSRSNFELTKRYLESLSVQYAHNSFHPRAFSAVDFKLAMFELWIHMLQEEFHKSNDEQNQSPTHEFDDTFPEDPMSGLFSSANTPSSNALEIIMNEAHEIHHQLETLMQAPIYSNRSDYLNLLKGVTQWIADLEMRTSQRLSPGVGSSLISEGS